MSIRRARILKVIEMFADSPPPLTLHYVFDPLCGWCYAAAPALAELAVKRDWTLTLQPWGLFCGAGVRQMSAELARYIWSHDERIGRLTGLPFSGAYRRNALENPNGRLDSTLSTRALTIVRANNAELELPFLHRLQMTRYVEGRDLTDPDVLGDVASEFGSDAHEIAERVVEDRMLADETQERILGGKALMRRLGAWAVPTLVVDTGQSERFLQGEVLYRGPGVLLAEIETAMSVE